jgi:HEAT repeat protein
VVDALANLGSKGGVRFLLFALTDEEPAIRSSAAVNLGMIGGADAVDGLRGLVSDPVDTVRAAAARALGVAGDPAALDTLLDLLGDENGFVVTSAMEAAGKLGGSAARDALAGMLGSADPEIRRTAITSLKSFPGADVLILPYLRDPDWATRLAAVESLTRKASEEVRAAVEGLYDGEDDPVVRKAIEERFYAR